MSEYSSKPAILPVARTLVPTAFLLALAYFCGLVFQEATLTAWGFEPSLFPLNTQETYLQAFIAAIELSPMLMDWIGHSFSWLILAAIILALLDALRVRRRWERFRQSALGQRVAKLSPLTGDSISIRIGRIVWIWVAVLGAALVSVNLLAVLLSSAAQHSVSRAWDTHAIDSWAQVSWKEEDGGVQVGKLKSCSEKWCAIIQDRTARVVATDRITRIEKNAPQSSNPNTRASGS